MDHVFCSGLEYSLTECETANNTRRTTHSEDVAVICQPGEVYYKGECRNSNVKQKVNEKILVCKTWYNELACIIIPLFF